MVTGYVVAMASSDGSQGIDRKIPLDELAASKDLDFYELLDEIEAIVFSGTKININYFLDQVIDPEIQNEIFDYFRESAEVLGSLYLVFFHMSADHVQEAHIYDVIYGRDHHIILRR